MSWKADLLSILLYLQAGSRLDLLLSVNCMHAAVFSGQHLKCRQVSTRSAVFYATQHEGFSAAYIGYQGLTAPLLHSKSASAASPTFLLFPDAYSTSNPRTEICCASVLWLAWFEISCAKFQCVQPPVQSWTLQAYDRHMTDICAAMTLHPDHCLYPCAHPRDIKLCAVS